MTKKKLYSEGDLFFVPLKDNTFCLGLITHINSESKVPLGWFFEKKFNTIPESVDIKLIKEITIVLVRQFGIQGFKNRTWIVIGKYEPFLKEQWPIPIFIRHTEPFAPRFVYYDQNLEEINSQTAPTGTDTSLFYKDVLSGSGIIEEILTTLTK